MDNGDDCTCECFRRLNLALARGLVDRKLPVEIRHELRCKSYVDECCDCEPIVLVPCMGETLSIQQDGSGVPLHEGEEMDVN